VVGGPVVGGPVVGGGAYSPATYPPPGPAPGAPAAHPLTARPTQPPPSYQAGRAAPVSRAPRRRRRGLGWVGCLFTSLGLIVAVLAVLVLIGYLTQPSEGELGRPAKDGQFTFVVRGPAKCGTAARIAGITPSKGKLCQIPFSVTNTGTKRRTLAPGYQELYDADDRDYPGAILLRGGAREQNRVAPQLLSPGATFSGVVLFDVPPGFQPTSVVIHDDSTSNGVRVPAS
jgi:hypothetical protein